MKIELRYFGRPAERLQSSREWVDLPVSVITLGDLLDWLRLRGEIWAQELAQNRVRCAINQEFSNLQADLKDGDEVAIFSPISGG